MARPVLPVVIVNNVTPNHNAHAIALAKQYNMGAALNVVNAMDPQYGLLGDGSDESTALNALYAEAVSRKLPLWLPQPPTAYGFASDWEWDSNLVSVLGAGSGVVPLQAIGTARIIAKPASFTIAQGPRFGGFTVLGDAAAPAGATGIYSGDITAAEWDDIVFRGFRGAGSIGLHLDTETNWTELNRFRRIRCDDNAVGIRCSVSGGSNSFARNMWDVHFNLTGDDQIGFQTDDDALLYGQKGSFDGNATADDGVFVDLLGTSSMSGLIDMDFEQTSGTGARGIREFNPGFQFFCRGVRNYAETMAEDIGGGVDLYQLPGGLRIKEGLSNSRQGAQALGFGADPDGQATILTSAVKDAVYGQRIDLTRQLGGGTRGHLEIGTRVPGVSFVIKSVDAAGSLVADTSVVSWRITERY